MNALKIAVHLAGGQSELGRRINRRQSTIQYWLDNGKVAPEACPLIEEATGGVITRQHLRSDIFGEPTVSLADLKLPEHVSHDHSAGTPPETLTAPTTLNDIVGELDELAEATRPLLEPTSQSGEAA